MSASERWRRSGFVSPHFIAVLGGVCLFLGFSLMAWRDQQQHDLQWQTHLNAQAEVKRLTVNEAAESLRRQAQALAELVAADQRVRVLIQKGYAAVRAEGGGTGGPRSAEIREQLHVLLAPYWQAIALSGGRQLHIHLAPDATTLLRMHEPETFGDILASVRFLVMGVLNSGEPHSGLEIGRNGAGMRAVVPVRADDQANSPVIGALEVGFSMLPQFDFLDKQLDAGVALLLRSNASKILWQHGRANLSEDIRGDWLLDNHSRPEVEEWFKQGALPSPEALTKLRVLHANGHDYLLQVIAFPDFESAKNPTHPAPLAVMVWQDISAALAAKRASDRTMWLSWILPLVAAELLLFLLLWATRQSAQRVAQTHAAAQAEVNRRNAQMLLRAKEAAEAASRAKSEFLASMSHELRTPLNAVLGFAQLISSDPQAAKSIQHNATEIEQAGWHLLALVDDVINLARIESGKLEFSLGPVCARTAIAESLTMVAAMASAHHVELINDQNNSFDCYVRVDPVRLQQVLINLLSNAIKYNRPQGSVRIACAAAAGFARIAVTDSGPGISAEKQSRLFNAFDRLGAELGAIEGTGIGLVITKRIVEAMGGRIGFESTEGQGSTFWVQFPLTEAPLKTEAAAVEVVSKPNLPAQRYRVLCVEDNPVNQLLMQKVFKNRDDIEFLCAATAEQGIELARAERPALILMDLNLPGMDGYAALSTLKSDARTTDIPVIAVSASAMQGDRERGLHSGFIDYISKPINVQQLLAKVDGLLRGGVA